MSGAIADALKSGTDDVLIPAVHDTGTALKNAFHSVADGAENVAGNVEDNEADLVRLLSRNGGRDAEVPVYLVDDDGQVHLLAADGSGQVIRRGEETSGIDGLLDEDGRIPREGRADYPLARDNPSVAGSRVASTKVPAGDPGLPEATLRARRYAQDGTLKNYAAVSYDEEGKAFVLVGRSNGPHSETVVGVPLLRNGMAGGVKDLYTERAPCHVAQHYCGEWLHKYFAGASVTHSFEYGPGQASQRVGNKELRKFLEGVGLR
jgi:Xanthomonas XOO_2897-like deaminase